MIGALLSKRTLAMRRSRCFIWSSRLRRVLVEQKITYLLHKVLIARICRKEAVIALLFSATKPPVLRSNGNERPKVWQQIYTYGSNPLSTQLMHAAHVVHTDCAGLMLKTLNKER